MNPQSWILALALSTATLPAFAQAAAPIAPHTASDTDTQTFEDWTVRCFAGRAPPCEMVQQAQNKAGRRVTAIVIAFLPKQNRFVLQIATPLGVSFAHGLSFNTSGYSSQPMPFQRCDANGCYVEGVIERGALEALAKSSPQGKLSLAAADGRAINLPLSLRGFEQARIVMEDLAQQKASAAPAKSATEPLRKSAAP